MPPPRLCLLLGLGPIVATAARGHRARRDEAGKLGIGLIDEDQHAEHRHIEAESGLLPVPGGRLPHGEPFAGNDHEAEIPDEEGEQAGEVIGPKVQANPYKLEMHEWYPFDKAVGDLSYRSFTEHARTFDNWSSWFKDYLFSRYYTKRASKTGAQDKVFAEGIVFYNLKRKTEGKMYMAKLRRDMFPWFYEGIEIIGYDQKGRDEIEDQEKFE